MVTPVAGLQRTELPAIEFISQSRIGQGSWKNKSERTLEAFYNASFLLGVLEIR